MLQGVAEPSFIVIRSSYRSFDTEILPNLEGGIKLILQYVIKPRRPIHQITWINL